MDTLTINKYELATLKRMYAKAVKEGKTQFVFQAKDILTVYAKYLIEYLESRFKK